MLATVPVVEDELKKDGRDYIHDRHFMKQDTLLKLSRLCLSKDVCPSMGYFGVNVGNDTRCYHHVNM